ncbi:MAG: hypothetical protein MZV70_30050 [Desulfobacterales bacterium]|nr:hypothetical protein [Desulfobacterales bacterium]
MTFRSSRAARSQRPGPRGTGAAVRGAGAAAETGIPDPPGSRKRRPERHIGPAAHSDDRQVRRASRRGLRHRAGQVQPRQGDHRGRPGRAGSAARSAEHLLPGARRSRDRQGPAPAGDGRTTTSMHGVRVRAPTVDDR